jgi:signal transduction histidine kinase
MIFYEIKNKKDGKIVVSNMESFSYVDRFAIDKNTKLADIYTISRTKESDEFFLWIVSVGDKDLFSSNIRFGLVVDTYFELSGKFFEYFLIKMNAHSHTITTIQGQMTTKLEGIISRGKFRAHTYMESINKIKTLISGKEDELSEILFYIDKRLFDMRNQIDGFNLLYANKHYVFKPEDYNPVNIKKVLLSTATPFLDQLREKKVKLDIDNITDSYAQNNKVNLNYKFFNLALYNFFDNITKYIKNGSNLKITFQKNTGDFFIFFEMISRYIEPQEFSLIFEDGYSGKHASGLSGNGIGMFYTKKALNLIGLDIRVESVTEVQVFEENRYSNNIFKIFVLE